MENISTVSFYGWDNVTMQLNKILLARSTNCNIIIFNFVEAQLDERVWKVLNETLIKNKKIQCTLICGMLSSLEEYKKLEFDMFKQNLPNDNCKVVIWTEYFIWHSFMLIEGCCEEKQQQGIHVDEYKKKYYNNDLSYRKYKFPFASFNGKIRPHRSLFIDKLAETNMIDKGFVTYHGMRKEMNYTKEIDVEYNFFKYNMIEENNLAYFMDETQTIASADINESFTESFLHIPCETNFEEFTLTEKTILPILFKYPFLTVGSRDFHKHLQDLGFQLYDEIFDYDFDKDNDLRNRIDGVVNNIKYIYKNFTKVYEMQGKIESKLQHNYDRCIDIIKDKKNYPAEIVANLNHESLSFVRRCYNKDLNFLLKLWY